MRHRRRALAVASFVVCAASVLMGGCSKSDDDAAIQPYDERADAQADLDRALERARGENKHVLVVFGANWCPDCRSLAKKMSAGALAGHVADRYVLSKVDVGHFDKNTPIAQRFGNVTSKGIPAVVVLASDGRLIKATRGGELASARQLGDRQLLDVFEKLAADN
ncbi:MAG: thioredoxin family protein [Burkholderiaceae bacterium]